MVVVAGGSPPPERRAEEVRRACFQLRGGACALRAFEIDGAAEAEDDDLLRLLGFDEAGTVQARRWLAQQLGSEELAVEVRLSPEQVLLALPDDVLRALSDSYLETLSEETRAAIRERIGRWDGSSADRARRSTRKGLCSRAASPRQAFAESG
ncbi:MULTISPECIES: hypothetical protein [Sorangium]|uniref:Uncharacterized protein n=1 Tax=Sorangium cellulosum (strain So ce56) TaxID=448385 RepID=A9GSJ2_SORC5|nr:hypothetical protein [Sorangium cellulosum]CAN93786.1 hypothetical protein sce3626 [Sorangium cellulosum So ce56]